MDQFPFEQLRPITPDYAELPILEGFNWAECFATIDEARLYLVVFRSVRRETADPVRLKMFDDLAYEEARAASGLLYYFRGSLNLRRECLSFCLWDTQDQAEAATRLTSHAAAADLTEEMYESFVLERWILTKRSGSTFIELRPATHPAGLPASLAPVGSLTAHDAEPEVATLPKLPESQDGAATRGSGITLLGAALRL
jgi:hypothetical protein